MGYNGFGLRKEVYTRKPKKPFINLKKITDVEITHHSQKNPELGNVYTNESKKLVQLKLEENKKKNLVNNIISLILGFIIIIVLYFIINEYLKNVY